MAKVGSRTAKQQLKKENVQGTKRTPDWRRWKFFPKQTCLKNEWKIVALLTKEKGKPAMNEWENDDSDIPWAFCSVYKQIRTTFFYTYSSKLV